MDRIFIPVGEECYTCQSIDGKFSNSIRKQGFPFDYVGHTFVENIYDNFLDIFEEGFELLTSDFESQKFDNIYYFVHKKYGFKYWHDVSSCDGNFNDNDCNVFIEKYNRRYKRLYDSIKNSNNTEIYFLSVNHFDNIYSKVCKPQYIQKLYDLLHSHNKNIKFIAINYGENLSSNANLHFINLPVNYSLPFEKSKIEFTKTLYKYVSTIYTLEHLKWDNF